MNNEAGKSEGVIYPKIFFEADLRITCQWICGMHDWKTFKPTVQPMVFILKDFGWWPNLNLFLMLLGTMVNFVQQGKPIFGLIVS